MVVTFLLLVGKHDAAVGQDAKANSQVREEAQRFVNAFGKISNSLRKYAIVGTVEIPNLKASTEADPVSTISDFIIASDQDQRFRRQSVLRETVDLEGELRVSKWFTRIAENRKIRAGYDESGLEVVESIKAPVLPDFEPWDLAIASSFDFRSDRVSSGYFLMKCDPRQVISYTEGPIQEMLVFQVGAKTRLFVSSEKVEKLPTYAQWRVSDGVVSSDRDREEVDSYSMVVSDVACKWLKLDGNVWVPSEIIIRRLNSRIEHVAKPIEILVVKMQWCPIASLESLDLVDSKSEELFPLIQERARLASRSNKGKGK